MRNEVAKDARNSVNIPASKAMSRVCRKNYNDNDRRPLLIFAHLAWLAVQHEGIKRGNYAASLSFSDGLGNAVAARRVSVVREGFFDIFAQQSAAILHASAANILIHNKYCSGRRHYK